MLLILYCVGGDARTKSSPIHWTPKPWTSPGAFILIPHFPNMKATFCDWTLLNPHSQKSLSTNHAKHVVINISRNQRRHTGDALSVLQERCQWHCHSLFYLCNHCNGVSMDIFTNHVHTSYPQKKKKKIHSLNAPGWQEKKKKKEKKTCKKSLRIKVGQEIKSF